MIQHTRHNPFISIIIVNFNGQHLLENCLNSLFKLDYPKRRFEVVLVDNNSSDDSVPFVCREFPHVKLVLNQENTGFTGGNIAGLQAAKGEYIVLLNSDVVVDKNWLKALVIAAQNPEVGIVSSRLRYATPFVELTIESRVVPKSMIFQTIDHSPIGVLIEEVQCQTPKLTELVYYKNGFYDKIEGEISTRRTKGTATILLPLDHAQKTTIYNLTLHGLESTEPLTTPVTIYVNGKEKKRLSLGSRQAIQLTIQVNKKEVEDSYTWLIQNAGNIILRNGYGKDRGSAVTLRDNEQREFYEPESEYFEQPAELLAACGASCLIKRQVIDNVGFLDGHYFMYYEDVDFSLRAWRAGWKIIYEPMSIGYHKHRATTGSNESSLFLSLIERNHLTFVIAHFSALTIGTELVSFLARLFITFVKFIVFQFRDNETRAETWRIKWEGRYAALRFLLSDGGRLVKNRFQVQALWPIDTRKLQRMLY